MKRKTFAAVISMLALGGTPVMAEEPSRPVLEAALQAAPAARLEAARLVSTTYPALLSDLHAELKSTFPNMEHGVARALMKTRSRQGGSIWSLVAEARGRFAPRLGALRLALKQEMESSYPDFEARLNRVLSEHGPAARWRTFLLGYSGSAATEDALAHLLRTRRELPQAVAAEFPGIAGKAVGVVGRVDPTLPSELIGFVRQESRAIRSDFRAFLEAELPGFEQRVDALISTRYPHLKRDLLAVLNG